MTPIIPATITIPTSDYVMSRIAESQKLDALEQFVFDFEPLNCECNDPECENYIEHHAWRNQLQSVINLAHRAGRKSSLTEQAQSDNN